MGISEGLLTNAISSILNIAAGKAWKSLPRKEKVLKILDHAGLKSGIPDPDFQSVYVHALIEYGVEQTRESVLNLFRRVEIRNAFKRSFERKDPSILNHEAAAHVNWGNIGEELRFEFARFTLVFKEMVDQTRTPAEARREGKLDENPRIEKEGDLDAIREKNSGDDPGRRGRRANSGRPYKVFISRAYRDIKKFREIVQNVIAIAMAGLCGVVWRYSPREIDPRWG